MKTRQKGWPHTGLAKENPVEYYTYRAMLSRCFNKNNPSSKHYLGRGISVTDNWLGKDGFKTFLQDMGNRPGKGYSLDRIDGNKGYSKENCRWATWITQEGNRCNSNEIVGVSKHNQNGGWEAYISVNGVRHMRCFRNRDDAIKQRREWERELL